MIELFHRAAFFIDCASQKYSGYRCQRGLSALYQNISHRFSTRVHRQGKLIGEAYSVKQLENSPLSRSEIFTKFYKGTKLLFLILL